MTKIIIIIGRKIDIETIRRQTAPEKLSPKSKMYKNPLKYLCYFTRTLN